MLEGSGRGEDGLKALDEGVRHAESPRSQLAFRMALGRVAAARNDAARSRKEMDEALRLATTLHDPFAEGRALEGLAGLERARMREEEARALLARAEAAYSEANRPADAKRVRDAGRGGRAPARGAEPGSG
jgi:hypothetical protein